MKYKLNIISLLLLCESKNREHFDMLVKKEQYNKISVYTIKSQYMKQDVHIYNIISINTTRFLYIQQVFIIYNKISIYTTSFHYIQQELYIQHDVYVYNNISYMYNKNYRDITRFLYLWQQGCYGYIEILLYIYVKIRDMYVKIPINTTRLQRIHHDYIH